VARAVQGTDPSDTRVVSRDKFIKDLVDETKSQRRAAYLYLMLEENGRVAIQWEGPAAETLRHLRYRIGGTGDERCPHCAILAGIEALAPVLPLTSLRAARTRDGYLLLISMNMLPCAAFQRDAMPQDFFGGSFGRGRMTAGWAADCHMGQGDPHTEADCPRHRRGSV
jgi:hypothetical protein